MGGKDRNESPEPFPNFRSKLAVTEPGPRPEHLADGMNNAADVSPFFIR